MRTFIKTMHTAKIQTERKMRADLDQKILRMDSQVLCTMLGKTITEKARYLSRLFRLHGASKVNEGQISDHL